MEKKLKRSELKAIIKECLLEIIIEGSPKTVIENVRNRNTPEKVVREAIAPLPAKASLEKIFPGGAPPRGKESGSKKTPASTNQFLNLINDPVMAAMFAETANSGLVETMASEKSSPMSANPIVDTGLDPLLFEGSQNWANIAFAEKRKP